MRLDGFGLLVNDMPTMIRFYRDVLGFEINNVLLDWHTFADPATLRRELYDYRFLDRGRDGKVYCLAQKQPKPEELGL